MKNWKHNVRFVLVEPTEPGNIGASARAIKNMGFKNLALVTPPDDTEGYAERLAHNATDVLRAAKEYPSLADALAEASLVIGTSCRGGKRRGMVLPVDEAIEKVFNAASRGGNVAVLFGRERVGLSSAETDECAFMINIPTSSRQPSLNLAQAVMLVAYELGKLQMETPKGESPGLLSTHAGQAALSRRLTRVLELLGYTKMGDRTIARKILVTIKHFLGRAGLTGDELDMLEGICTRLVKRLEK